MLTQGLFHYNDVIFAQFIAIYAPEIAVLQWNKTPLEIILLSAFMGLTDYVFIYREARR